MCKIAERQLYGKRQTRFNPERHDLHTLSRAGLLTKWCRTRKKEIC